MLPGIIFLAIYLIITAALDFLPEKRKSGSPNFRGFSSDSSFFLSGKSMSSVVLLISIAATNFSAFTILGLSGAGYRLGYAFYPVMAFGTGFMALGMYLVGEPLGELGRKRSYISPADFILDRYGSPALAKVYSIILVIITLPYLALQPMAAGIILESFFGVPYRIGVVASLAVVGLYTTRGGMRAVARTDLIQGVIMLVLAAAAYAAVSGSLGGFFEAHNETYRTAPRLFERSGAGAGINLAVLAGYIVLWFFADPMFPQLNQRFLAAGSSRTLERTVAIYPLVTMVLFFLTISTGVLGAGALPGLSVSESDRIWPVMIAKAAGPVPASLFMIAPLAAIMSTLDSQLLSLSSIVTRDLLGKKNTGLGKIKIITAAIAAAGLIIALFPPNNILDFISKSSFLGYAALAPLVFGGLYGRRFNSIGAFSCVIVGEGLVLLLGTGIIISGRIPAVFVVCGASWLAMIAGSQAGRRSSGFPVYRLRDKLPLKWAAAFIILFILGCDFINYIFLPETDGPPPAGLPGWMYYQVGLCILLAGVYFVFFRKRNNRSRE